MRKHSAEYLEKRCEGLEVRPINKKDLEKYCPDASLRNSIRGYMFFQDGEFEGVAGIENRPDGFYVFSDLPENGKMKKITIWRCSQLILSMIKKIKTTTVATSEKKDKSAQAFVKALGFEPYAEDGELVHFYREAG